MIDSSLPMRLAESIPHGPHRMTVGLRPLALAEWIEDGADFDDQLRERAALLREREDVLGVRPGSQQAQRELLDLLIKHLREHFTERYSFSSPQRVRIKPTGQESAQGHIRNHLPLYSLGNKMPYLLNCILLGNVNQPG